MNKKGQQNNIIMTILGVLLIAVLLDGAGIISLSQITGKEPAVTPTVISEICSDPSNTLTLGPQKAKWNPSTAVTDTLRYFKVSNGENAVFNSGNDKGNKADSATDVVNNKDGIKVVYGFTSSTYYATSHEFTMPCGPIDSASRSGGLSELIANGTITFNVFNSDTGNKNTGAGVDNETINTAEEGRFDFRSLTTLDKTGFSPEGNIIATVELNKSMYDEAVTTFNGVGPTTSTPSFYEELNVDSTVRAWTYTGCPDRDSNLRSCNLDLGELKVKADTAENPVGEGQANSAATSVGLGDVKVCLFDEDYWQHTIDGTIGFSVQDDVGSSAGFVGNLGQCIIVTVD